MSVFQKKKQDIVNHIEHGLRLILSNSEIPPEKIAIPKQYIDDIVSCIIRASVAIRPESCYEYSEKAGMILGRLLLEIANEQPEVLMPKHVKAYISGIQGVVNEEEDKIRITHPVINYWKKLTGR